ncbi:MAG: TIGR02281 family clan AA aspartic protease [Candidatus Aadella gelida]|nr:TIGR02281 family clan AA aspartic protease [Candidatus Aadella gelida]
MVDHKMKNKGFRIVCLVVGITIILSLCPCSVYSVEIGDPVELNLKNKGKITGTVKEESSVAIVLDMGFGTMAISRDDIESIDVLNGSIARDRLHRSSSESKKEQEKKWRARIDRNKQIKDEMIERRQKMIEHKIKFDDPTSIVAEALIDGEVVVDLVVDTGASLVIIPKETAELAGYTVLDPKRKMSVRLADGSLVEGTPITLKSIEVAGVVAENVEGVVVGERENDGGLLGMSFLNRFDVHIDPDKKEMILKEL